MFPRPVRVRKWKAVLALSRLNAGVDGIGALLAGRDEPAGWALIVYCCDSPAGHHHVDVTEPPG